MAKTETPAELTDEMVKHGMEHYRMVVIETVISLFQGGRLPGVEPMSEDTLQAFFRKTPAEWWIALAQQKPEEAVELLNEFERVENAVAS